MRRVTSMSMELIISNFIKDIEHAYDNNQGEYSFCCLLEQAENSLYNNCEQSGLNGMYVHKLAVDKLKTKYPNIRV